VISKLGREFRTKVQEYIKATYLDAICFNEPISMYIEFGFKDGRLRDLDNLSKAIIDACKGILYVDDSLIHELHTRKFLYQDDDFINIEIRKLSDETARSHYLPVADENDLEINNDILDDFLEQNLDKEFMEEMKIKYNVTNRI
jgi:Holliday junction resolvase RusA-like endonuclease